jgi:hypothetical protein
LELTQRCLGKRSKDAVCLTCIWNFSRERAYNPRTYKFTNTISLWSRTTRNSVFLISMSSVITTNNIRRQMLGLLGKSSFYPPPNSTKPQWNNYTGHTSKWEWLKLTNAKLQYVCSLEIQSKSLGLATAPIRGHRKNVMVLH